MPAAKVRADHDALRQIAQKFNGSAQTIEQTTQKLKSNLETLRGGDWAGKGADKFYAEMESAVLPTYKRLSKALCTASNVTLKIDKIMQQAEDDATALFRGGEAGSNGDGTREKGGEGAFPTGAVIGGVLGAGLGLVGVVGGAIIGHAIDNYLDESKARTEADQARRDAVQKYIQSDDPNSGLAAVREAIKQYNIDASGFKDIKFDPHQNPKLDAVVTEDGVMTIGPGAFRSPGYLASTVGHEALHIRQKNEGRLINGDQGVNMNEVEAYNWELQNAEANGLSDMEIRTITRRRDSHYNKLSDANKERVGDGNYTPA